MQLRFDQLAYHLDNLKSNPILGLYFLWGEEALLIQESADQLRNAAFNQNFTERLLFIIDSENTLEWEAITEACSQASIFSDKKIIEIVLTNAKWMDSAISFFKNCPAILNHNPDILLLVRVYELTPALKKAAWFNALSQHKNALIIPHPYLNKNQLTQWIIKQAQIKNLKLEPDVLQTMVSQNEGNTLAAHQTLELLFFTANQAAHADQTIQSIQTTQPNLSNQNNKNKLNTLNLITLDNYNNIINLTQSSRFTLFEFQDTLLKGEPNRIIIILSSLNPSELLLILWAILKITRTLIQVHYQSTQNPNKPLAQALQALAIWPSLMPLYTAAFKRMSINLLNKILQQAQSLEYKFKTGDNAQAWRELIDVCLEFKNN